MQDLGSLPEMRDRTREHVNAAIRSLPLPLTQAYWEAMKICPQLVRTESDAMHFVRYCGYDIWKAANRLCRYWLERKKLFKEKAFLPLILTGSGALSEQEMMLLQAGYPAILPDNPRTGQKVLFVDRRKVIPNTTTESKLKNWFYIFSIIAQDDRSPIDGVLVIAILNTPRLFDVDREYQNRIISLTSDVFPCKLLVHLLSIPHQKKPYLGQDMVIKTVVPLMQSIANVDIHIEEEPGQLVEELQELGLTRQGIPLCIGGEWKFEESFTWTRQRYEWERIQFGGAAPAAVARSSLGHAKDADNSIKSDDDRRRLADMLHSRRKRERRRQHFLSLKEESQSLVQEHRTLKAENERLQSLLDQAQQVVEKID